MITKKVEAKAPGRQGLHGRESPLGGKGLSQDHMGSTKENESDNKIYHERAAPTHKKQRRQDFAPKGNIRENRKMWTTDVVGYEVLKCQ